MPRQSLRELRHKVSLKTLEPLHIGAPQPPGSGKENNITIVGNRLVIPGPSLKGALRAEIERYLIEQFWKDGKWDQAKVAWKPCIPADRPSPDERRLIAQNKYREGGNCHYPCPKDTKHGGKHSLCPACYLLGAMGLSGFVSVPFLHGEGDSGLAQASGELYSAARDRAVNTVRSGANRSYFLVPSGVAFSGLLTVLIEDRVTGYLLGRARTFNGETTGDAWLEGRHFEPEGLIQEFVLDRLAAIKNIGGYKSKGFGRIEITATVAT
ncbi:MAG: RAMP superfamily CRISPR-associated protein [Terriglobia bacterium]